MPQASVLKSVIQPKASMATTVRPHSPPLPEQVSGNDEHDMEAMLSVLVENAPVAMAMFDTQMRYLLANHEWVKFWGLQAAQPLVGRSQFEVFPNLHPGWRTVYERGLMGHTSRNEHDVMHDPAGRQVVFRWEVRPWRKGVHPQVAGLMVTFERFSPPPAAEVAAADPVGPDVQLPEVSAAPSLWDVEGLPIIEMDLDGVIHRANATATDLALAKGFRPGKTGWWDVFAAPGPEGHVQRALVIKAAAQTLSAATNLDQPSIVTPHPEAADTKQIRWAIVAAPETEDEARVWALGVVHDRPAAPAPVMVPVAAPPVDTSALEKAFALERRALEARLAEAQRQVETAPAMEATFKRREQRQREVLDAMPCGLMVLDDRGRPMFHNAHVRDLFGRELKPGDLVEQWLAEACLNETQRAEVASVWRESVWRRQLTKVVSLTTTDGLLKDFELRPIPLPSGGMLVTVHDVTDHCRLEEMLHATEAKLRAVMHESPVPIVLTDKTGAIFDANRATERLLGRPRGDLRRTSIGDWIAPPSLAAYREELSRVAAVGQAPGRVTLSFANADAGASEVSMELAAIPDSEGKLHAVAHFIQAVPKLPEEISGNEVAAIAEQLFGRASDATEAPSCPPLPLATPAVPQTVLTANCHGRLLTWSLAAEAIFDCPEPAALQRSLHSFFRPSDPTGFAMDLEESFAQPRGTVFALACLRPDGSRVQQAFHIERDDDTGRITLRTPAEPDTEDAAPEPTHAVAPVALSTSLLTESHHRITSHLQLLASLLSLQTSDVTEATAHQALRASRNRVRAIAALHQLLFEQATGAGGSFATLATQLLHHLRDCYEAPEHRIAVTLEIAPVALQPDVLMPLALVLNEALSHALQHAFPGQRTGQLHVALRHDQGHLHLTVQDDGHPHGTDAEGQDLGLRVMRLLAAQLQGDVSLENINPSGTCVELRFPIRCIDN